MPLYNTIYILYCKVPNSELPDAVYYTYRIDHYTLYFIKYIFNIACVIWREKKKDKLLYTFFLSFFSVSEWRSRGQVYRPSASGTSAVCPGNGPASRPVPCNLLCRVTLLTRVHNNTFSFPKPFIRPLIANIYFSTPSLVHYFRFLVSDVEHNTIIVSTCRPTNFIPIVNFMFTRIPEDTFERQYPFRFSRTRQFPGRPRSP